MVQACIDRNKLSFVRLRDSYSVEHFCCGDADLDDFIQNRATAFQKLHQVHVRYREQDRLSFFDSGCLPGGGAVLREERFPLLDRRR